jgi:hypothetical protein
MTRRPICSSSGPLRLTRTGDPFHLTAPGPIPKERQLLTEISTVYSHGLSRPTPGMEGKGWNGFQKGRWIDREWGLAGKRIDRSRCMVWEFWMDGGIWPAFFFAFQMTSVSAAGRANFHREAEHSWLWKEDVERGWKSIFFAPPLMAWARHSSVKRPHGLGDITICFLAPTHPPR